MKDDLQEEETKQERVLQLLRKNVRVAPKELAERSGLTLEEVIEVLALLEREGELLGYHACVNESQEHAGQIVAFIEVRVTPEREGGFDRIARRLARFDEVDGLYLMSGGYDLLVTVRGSSIHDVAQFVTSKLSTMGTIRSFATRFRLKTYKEHGILHEVQEEERRLSVTP